MDHTLKFEMGLRAQGRPGASLEGGLAAAVPLELKGL